MSKIFFFLFFLLSSITCISKNDIPNFDKYYKPREFSNMDMFSESSKWSWTRYKQSEHFFVFWEAGFGSNPNSNNVPQDLRVDIDDLLEKAEQFFTTNIVKNKFAVLGSGKSNLDKYKMEIYMLYQTEWLATGSGYDDVIGALWVNPSTCHPVGSTIAHEIGHSFQYQVFCDQILQGATSATQKHSGFRYGYEGSNGGNGFWEQTAQWQAYLDYPEEMFNSYHFQTIWPLNCHRHFEHEWMRYASYWLHFYWASKHGVDSIGNVWRNSKYPEDAIMAYMRLYNDDSWELQREELFDYAMKMASFDFDTVRPYSTRYQGKYKTNFIKNGDYLQIPYNQCPGATGFNIINLAVPSGEKTVEVEFVGLTPGDSLASGDKGEYKANDAVAGTVKNYNSVNKGNVGWRYGFAAHLNNDKRVYSDTFSDSKGTASFTVPNGTSRLYFVVQGSPEKYIQYAWDEDERTDAQFPYKIKLSGTSLK